MLGFGGGTGGRRGGGGGGGEARTNERLVWIKDFLSAVKLNKVGVVQKPATPTPHTHIQCRRACVCIYIQAFGMQMLVSGSVSGWTEKRTDSATKNRRSCQVRLPTQS